MQNEVAIENNGKNEQSWGQIIMFSSKLIHLSIGPNYREFFVGFLILLFYEFGLMYLTLSHVGSALHVRSGVYLCLSTPFLYLLTVLRDPGVYRYNQYSSKLTKYCHKCQHFTDKQTKHCQYCDVCISNYDHHCRWISKCIGKGNLTFFYIFIAQLSILNLYMYYTFYVVFWGK